MVRFDVLEEGTFLPLFPLVVLRLLADPYDTDPVGKVWRDLELVAGCVEHEISAVDGAVNAKCAHAEFATCGHKSLKCRRIHFPPEVIEGN